MKITTRRIILKRRWAARRIGDDKVRERREEGRRAYQRCVYRHRLMGLCFLNEVDLIYHD